MTKLPEWLEAELPEIRPVEYIDYDPMTMLFTLGDKEFDRILDAYNYANRKDINFEYTKHALNTEGVEESVIGPCYHNTWIAPYPDRKHYDYLEMIYRHWLEIDEAYQENSEDWVTAYNWLQGHPVFWTRQKNEKTWYWYTDRGARVYTMVGHYDGETKVGFETGGHTPCYTQTFHDLDLDVYAATFEEAYVELAKNVNKYFNPDGTEREGVRSER